MSKLCCCIPDSCIPDCIKDCYNTDNEINQEPNIGNENQGPNIGNENQGPNIGNENQERNIKNEMEENSKKDQSLENKAEPVEVEIEVEKNSILYRKLKEKIRNNLPGKTIENILNNSENCWLFLSDEDIMPVGKILVKGARVVILLKQEDMARVKHVLYSRGERTHFFFLKNIPDIDYLLDRCRKGFVTEENDSEESKNNNPEVSISQGGDSYDIFYPGILLLEKEVITERAKIIILNTILAKATENMATNIN